MDKAKREEANKIERLLIWMSEYKWEVFFGAIISFLAAFLIALFIGLIFTLYSVSFTTPAQRFEAYNSFYNQCVEAGVYPEDCNTAALDYAGLAGEE